MRHGRHGGGIADETVGHLAVRLGVGGQVDTRRGVEAEAVPGHPVGELRLAGRTLFRRRRIHAVAIAVGVVRQHDVPAAAFPAGEVGAVERGEREVGHVERALGMHRVVDQHVGRRRGRQVVDRPQPVPGSEEADVEVAEIDVLDRARPEGGVVVQIEADADGSRVAEVVAERFGDADRPDVLQVQSLVVVHEHAVPDVPGHHAVHGRRQAVDVGGRRNVRIAEVAGAVDVAGPEADDRAVGGVVTNLAERCPPDLDRVAVGDQRRVRQGGDLHARDSTEVGFGERFAPPDEAVRRRAGGHVADHVDAVALEPEAVAVDTEVLPGGPEVRVDRTLVAEAEVRHHGADGDVVDPLAGLVAGLGEEASTGVVIGHVAEEVDVARVVGECPARVAGHDRIGHDTRGGAGIGTATMEVHRVATANVVAAELLETAVPTDGAGLDLAEIDIVELLRLVGPAHVAEASAADLGVERVHHHEVATTIDLRVLRRELHVAGQVGDVEVEVAGRRHVVQLQRLAEPNGGAVDAGDDPEFVAGRAVRSGDDDLVAGIPADERAVHLDARVTGPGEAGDGRAMGDIAALHDGRAVEQRAAGDEARVLAAVDRAVVGELNRCNDVVGHRLLRRAHLERAAGCGHERVHLQLGVDVGREPERAVDTDALDLGVELRVDRDGHAGRNVDHAACPRHAAAPGGGRAPVAAGRRDVRGIGDLHQAHHCRVRLHIVCVVMVAIAGAVVVRRMVVMVVVAAALCGYVDRRGIGRRCTGHGVAAENLRVG